MMGPNQLSEKPPSCYFRTYKIIRRIHNGEQSQVFQCRNNKSNSDVSIKVYTKRMMFQYRTEVAVLKHFNHTGIIQLLDNWEDESAGYLVCPYTPESDLSTMITTKGKLTEENARNIFRKLVSTVRIIHQAGIAHRDLKLENVLVFDAGKRFVIIDWGFAYNYKITPLCKDTRGTPYYAAPEIYKQKSYNGSKIDIWALGICLYALITGRFPFDGNNCGEVGTNVISGEYHISPDFSSNLVDLLKKIICIDPDQRLTAEQILNHPWMVDTDKENPNTASTQINKTIDGKRCRTQLNETELAKCKPRRLRLEEE